MSDYEEKEFNVEEIRKMDPMDVIDQSMTSKEFREFLTIHKPLKANLTWALDTVHQYSIPRFIPANLPKGTHRRGTHRIFTFDERLILELKFLKEHEKCVRFYFGDQGNTVGESKVLKYGDPMKMVREEDAFKVIGRSNMEILTRDRHDLLLLECISKHILEILDVQKFHLSYGFLWDFKLEQSFPFKLTKRFESITVQTRYDDQVARNDLRKLLKNATNVKDLELCIELEPTTSPQRPLVFNCESLKIREGDWVETNDLMGATCKKIYVDRMEMNMEEVVQIVNSWKNGTRFRNLESMEIRMSNKLEGIEKEMDKVFGVRKANAQANAQRTVKRVTDGKIASLYLKPHLFRIDVQ
ncbi:hypothetical protein GCK72_021881 [Caenorhabditis remanei]|uniref:Sdz-33 F-box domain-containing protein n=1 Tax=Caenorhabditis remanei TaxID=31234 RepID=A0A6A5GLE8_CAERE|nr:hypothetical protein GCK72_021881 [Caenorhabditis remanei]KAF1755312.1 hypothetical protein GCK72_021881 [Caenorhabditis remanei]